MCYCGLGYWTRLQLSFPVDQNCQASGLCSIWLFCIAQGRVCTCFVCVTPLVSHQARVMLHAFERTSQPHSSPKNRPKPSPSFSFLRSSLFLFFLHFLQLCVWRKGTLLVPLRQCMGCIGRQAEAQPPPPFSFLPPSPPHSAIGLRYPCFSTSVQPPSAPLLILSPSLPHSILLLLLFSPTRCTPSPPFFSFLCTVLMLTWDLPSQACR